MVSGIILLSPRKKNVDSCRRTHLDEIDQQCTNIDPQAFFLPLVDAHNVGHEAGIPEEAFKALFHMCGQCGRYMTKRLFVHHSNWDEDYESEYSGESECIYLRREEQGLMNAEEYGKKHIYQ